MNKKITGIAASLMMALSACGEVRVDDKNTTASSETSIDEKDNVAEYDAYSNYMNKKTSAFDNDDDSFVRVRLYGTAGRAPLTGDVFFSLLKEDTPMCLFVEDVILRRTEHVRLNLDDHFGKVKFVTDDWRLRLEHNAVLEGACSPVIEALKKFSDLRKDGTFRIRIENVVVPNSSQLTEKEKRERLSKIK